MDELLQAEHFQPHVGKLVRFKEAGISMPLDSVVVSDGPLPAGLKRRPFLLIFRGPRDGHVLPEGLYACEIEDGPRYDLHVSPIQTPAPDRQEYQAAFN